MNKKNYIVLVLLVVSLLCKSQSDLSYQLNRFDKKVSTYEDVSSQIFDIENNYIYILRRNPAFIDLYYNNADSTLNSYQIKRMRPSAILLGSASFDKTNGDHVFYDGNKQFEGSVLAGGEKIIDGLGTLYGSASFSSGRKKNIYSNYATNPSDYYPYLVGDTLGVGDINNEKYEISGGFSFKHKGYYYGLGGTYTGISSSKVTDPRLSVYNSWLRLDFGIAKIIKNNLYSVKIYPELNRQNIDANNYTQKAASYFLYYGFGEWNRKESTIDNAYKKLMTINGIGADITYKRLSTNDNSINYTFNFVYNYRSMNTEDLMGASSLTSRAYKNLFSSTTHHFSPNFILSKRYKDFLFFLLLTGNNNIRKGTEHVYEKVSSSENNSSLKDYVKVGSNKLYSQNSYSNSAQFKAIYNLSPIRSLHFLGRINYDYYEEKYISPHRRICNQFFTPSIGIGYNSIFNKNSLEINLVFSAKRAIDNVFDLPAVDKETIIQQAYIPYLIRGEDNNTFSSEITYSHSVNQKSKIGSRVSFLYGQRTKAPYITSLSQFVDPNRESLRLNLNLFYIF